MLEKLWDLFHTRTMDIVTDDDSTMRAICKWSNKDWKENTGNTNLTIGWTTEDVSDPKRKPIKRKGGGRLRKDIPEPKFLADPQHRKKTLKNHLYKQLKLKKQDRCGLEEGDITRISHFYACMTRQIGEGDEALYVHKARAVLEHHFDNHEFCGDFCLRKKETFEEKASGEKVYRCKNIDHDLYCSLAKALEPFVTHQSLVEVAHGWDTNANESMNNCISWLAPKNKTFSGTQSLRNRVCMAISIQSLGYDEFYFRLFRELGLDVDCLSEHRFSQSQKARKYRIEQSKLAKNKRKRKVTTYKKVSEYFAKLKEDRAKGNEYAPSVAMPAPTIDDNEEQQQPNAVTVKRQCPHCGVYGHVTMRSAKCLYYEGRVVNSATETDETASKSVAGSVADDCIVSGHEGEHIDDYASKRERLAMEISLLDTLPCTLRDASELESVLTPR